MDWSVLPPAQWAETEFAAAELGDRRRTNRLVFMAQNLAQHPGGTLPQAFPEWEDLKAAYNFLDHPEVRFERVQQPHWEQTRAACRAPGEYLLIEDTMDLDYTGHPVALQLGFIGDGRGRGFRVHSTLALRVEGWTAGERPQTVIVGLAGQQCLCPPPAPPEESRGQRLQRARQSQRWTAELVGLGQPPAGCRWIYIADRESDFYEPIQRCQHQELDFIIRSNHDRCLADKSGHLQEKLAQAPIQGHMVMELRARPGQAARTAEVAVRCQRLHLGGPWRPGGWQPGFTVNVVEVIELAPPAGVKPLHWILLTSLPCDSWTQVQRVVGRYAARWLIEEYHKAVQSGTRVEDSQLEDRYPLEALIAILAMVALRLLNTKLLARTQPEEPVPAGAFGPEALAILAAKFGEPTGGWTHLRVLVAIARLGGFLARKHDGMPGWQTIWRGWYRLMLMCQGLDMLNQAAKRYG